MMPILFPLLLLALPQPSHSDVTGTVTSTEGGPIIGATVHVNSASVKTGTSPFCPSCYPDCGKTAVTDRNGGFQIAKMDPTLRFELVVVKDGYIPQIVSGVDPVKNDVRVELVVMSKDIEADRTIRGHVEDAKGQPLAGALVEPFGYKDGEQRGFGRVRFFADPLAVSNERGDFLLVTHKPGIALDLQVNARAHATTVFQMVPTGTEIHRLTVGEGATVTGQLLDRNDRPVASVKVGLVQADRRAETFTGPHEIGTDQAGRFTFVNVGPATEYFIYGIMSTLCERGAVGIKRVNVGGDGTTCQVGDLRIAEGYTLAGRVLLSDGKPIPADTRLLVGRREAWDTQIVSLDGNGRFRVKGVPPENVSVFVRVKGYIFSPNNGSYRVNNPISLDGLVDQDITDFEILLEPGLFPSVIHGAPDMSLGPVRLTGITSRPATETSAR